MKKAVVFHHVSNMGGGTISLVDVCHMLSEEYDVTVVIPKKNSEILTKRLEKYAKVVHFTERLPEFSYYSGSNEILSKGFFSSFWVKKEGIKNIVSAIENENPDIVIANSLVQLRMGKFLKHLKAKKIIYIRETFRENFISRKMIDCINKYFDGVLCIAPYEKRYADFKIPCEVVADCVFNDSESEGNAGINTGSFNVLYMGGASPLKGIKVMLEALEYIENPDIKLLIAGKLNFNMVKSLKNKIIHRKELIFEDNIKNLLEKEKEKIIPLGFVDNIESVMRKSGAVVFPSSKPHQPRPAIEAGEYGAAVIVSDFKQTEDFFRDGYNCLTFKSSDPKDLAEKITRLYEDSELRNKLIKNNKAMNSKCHNFRKEQDKLLSFIKKI